MPTKVIEQCIHVLSFNRAGFEKHAWGSQPVSGDSRPTRQFDPGIQEFVTNLFCFEVACRKCNG